MATIKNVSYGIRSSCGSTSPTSTHVVGLKVASTGSKYLLHKTVVIQESLEKQRISACKTRSEVRGGGRKPWKQKGTGHARSGSNTSPLWKGGGVIFGPKPRLQNKKINEKEWQLALSTALYTAQHKLVVARDFLHQIVRPNTKDAVSMLSKLTSLTEGRILLVVVDTYSNALSMSLRNLPGVRLTHVSSLRLKDILIAHTVLITETALLSIKNIIQV